MFLVFWPRGMWDLSSLTRDQTCTPCIGRWSLNHWTTREVPRGCVLQKLFLKQRGFWLKNSRKHNSSYQVWWGRILQSAGMGDTWYGVTEETFAGQGHTTCPLPHGLCPVSGVSGRRRNRPFLSDTCRSPCCLVVALLSLLLPGPVTDLCPHIGGGGWRQWVSGCVPSLKILLAYLDELYPFVDCCFLVNYT